MELFDFIPVMAGLCGVVGLAIAASSYFNSIKNEIVNASEENFNELKTDYGALKTELKQEVEKGFKASEENFNELKTDFGALKTELKTDYGALKTELKTDYGALKTELKTDYGALKTELKHEVEKGFKASEENVNVLKTDIGNLRADFAKFNSHVNYSIGRLEGRMFVSEPLSKKSKPIGSKNEGPPDASDQEIEDPDNEMEALDSMIDLENNNVAKK